MKIGAERRNVYCVALYIDNYFPRLLLLENLKMFAVTTLSSKVFQYAKAIFAEQKTPKIRCVIDLFHWFHIRVLSLTRLILSLKRQMLFILIKFIKTQFNSVLQ